MAAVEDNSSSAAANGVNHNQFEQIARKHWLENAKPITKVNAEVVKTELWSPLEKSRFASSTVLYLENLQVLERYLWPGFNQDSTNQHILLIAVIINAKQRENLPVWNLFEDRQDDFTTLFRRLLSLLLDNTLDFHIRTQLLLTIITAFQSLDNPLVRKECAPLVSIGIWQNLHSEAARERLLEDNPQFKKAWKLATKRYEAADDKAKGKLRFDRAWLYSLVLDFLTILYNTDTKTRDAIVYCERVMEFLCDLLSQFPTRRHVNTLVQDIHVLVLIKLSPFYRDGGNGLLRDLCNLLSHFVHFPFDDSTGTQYSLKASSDIHYARLAGLQRTALKSFKSKLTLLALSNYGSLEKRDELRVHLETLSDTDLKDLVTQLGYRAFYPTSLNVPLDRGFLLEVICDAHEKKQTFQEVVKEMVTLPTDGILNDESFARSKTYNGINPLAIPKLNLQYLSTGDFLWRSFILYRCETFYEVANDIEDTLKRLRPTRDAGTGEITFRDTSRMGLKISKPAVIEVVNPRVGEDVPAQIKAEIILDVSRLGENIRSEWESLRPDDVVFLVNADGANIKGLRSAEVIQVLDEYGKPLRMRLHQTNGYHGRPRQRRILVKLDANAYKSDMDLKAKGKADIYESLNIIVRRRNRENNFKAILNSIKELIVSDVPMPSWFQSVFLGLGDPSGANYKSLPHALKSVDYRDTFLDWKHLAESLPERTVKADHGSAETLHPPYVLSNSTEVSNVVDDAPSKRRRKKVQSEASHDTSANSIGQLMERPKDSDDISKVSKKRRYDEMKQDVPSDVVEVSTYKPLNMGPYASDEPKLNTVRFTPVQVEAITSGTQLGLTVVVGPPGTGKTDVATQIINNIYHNYPDERTLLIAHSNQALNQLFQKIVGLDIDKRHLLRLGHGEGDLKLETDASFSNHGRVESFMEIRAKLLAEVDRLALSLSAPGAHGNSCETADYFNMVYIKPIWTEYWTRAQASDTSKTTLTEAFPFHVYFSNAPQPLLPEELSEDELREIAEGCYRHIEKIFQELQDIRPFEVLRTAKDKANYLLISEARIIAMTATHAAIRRQEIANMGFRYDNVIMEEAAQVTEIENYIPICLQKPLDGEMSLKRIVLCGDHLQNSPIIQNLAFRHYANLEQSLFLRLVRLGVPTVMLNKQGRARPSIAELYKWRYPGLGNLPIVETQVEFQQANAGLRYDYQFINVSSYKGKGEMEPSPHFIQNLGEAEYAVALYMYMRLLGYPASRISILTMYAGQRALIKDVLAHRCAKHPLFGLPSIVTTVDQYQGEQNDYIILSLVRTTRVGYMRDIRRLTVALSRARLGLYILGRRSIFEVSLELQNAFQLLFNRPDKLKLVVGEMYSATSRHVNDDVESAEMDGVEHLGQYVFEMTKAKVADLKAGRESLPAIETSRVTDVTEDEDEEDGGVALPTPDHEDDMLAQDEDGMNGEMDNDEDDAENTQVN